MEKESKKCSSSFECGPLFRRNFTAGSTREVVPDSRASSLVSFGSVFTESQTGGIVLRCCGVIVGSRSQRETPERESQSQRSSHH